MSINDRLRILESDILPPAPTFAMACLRRWTIAQWFRQLGKLDDPEEARRYAAVAVIGLPVDDAEMMDQFRTCPDGFDLAPPPGSVPPEFPLEER